VRVPVRPPVSDVRHRALMPTFNDVHRQLSTRLDREWDQLGRRPAVLARARSWEITAKPFHSLDELLRLAGFKVAPSPEADETLRRLVITAADEPLAARIVLQRLLPGLLAIVRREQQRDRSVDAFDLIIGEAWLAIANYRADRRPTQVAARLLNDARHRAFTVTRRRQDRSCEDVVAPASLDLPRLPQPGSTFEELTIVLSAAHRAGLAAGDLALVCDYLGSRTSIALAAERNITPRTLRNRRDRAIGRVRVLAA